MKNKGNPSTPFSQNKNINIIKELVYNKTMIYNYYIGVITPKGLKLVTYINYTERKVYYEDNSKPTKLSQGECDDLVIQLASKGYMAMTIKVPYTIKNQIKK